MIQSSLTLLTAAVFAAQTAQPVPQTAEPTSAEAELLTEPGLSPPPQLYKPLELDAPAAVPAPTPVAPAPTAKKAMPPPTTPRLLVMDIVDQGGAKEVVGAISEATNSQAIASHAGEVVTTAQLKVALDASALQMMVGCVSDKCMADIANTVEAERVLGGTVTRVGADLLITLVLVDPRTGERKAQEQRKVPFTQDMYFYATKQLTSMLLTGKAVDPLVPVAISASEDGALIVLDGKDVGAAPMTLKLDPGDHEIRISKDGYVLWKTRATVEDATPLSVHADLTATRFPLWPFALTSAVITVSTASVATYFGLASMNSYSGFLGDPADSYTGAPQPDSAFLSDKRQKTIESAVWADVFWGSTAVFAAVTLGFTAWEIGSIAFSE